MISIVVPFYFYDFYVENMLKSINNQTFDKYEVIFVGNNLSSDEYSSIVQSINKTFQHSDRFSFFYTDLKNANAARQFGFEKSSGEYVFFLDSDDVLLNANLLEAINRIIQSNRPDIISVNMQRGIYDNGSLILGKVIYNYDLASEMLYKEQDLKTILNNYGTSIAGRFIKREILKDIKFKEVPFFQDWNVSSKIYAGAKTFYFYNTPSYIWVNRCSSISQFSKTTQEKYKKAFLSLTDMVQYYKQHNLIKDNKVFYSLRIIDFCFQYAGRGIRTGYPEGTKAARNFLWKNIDFSFSLIAYPAHLIRILFLFCSPLLKWYIKKYS